MTLCKKTACLRTLLKLIATLWKRGRIAGACLAIFLKFFDVVKQTKINLDDWEDSIVDYVWNIEAHRILSENWSGSARFRILKKTPG